MCTLVTCTSILHRRYANIQGTKSTVHQEEGKKKYTKNNNDLNNVPFQGSHAILQTPIDTVII